MEMLGAGLVMEVPGEPADLEIMGNSTSPTERPAVESVEGLKVEQVKLEWLIMVQTMDR